MATLIREAHRDLTSTAAREVTVSAPVPTARPYVIVFLPAAGVGSAAVKSFDLPAEAKDAIQRQVEHRDIPGALLGVVQADSSLWQPLPEGVDATGILFSWKQVGEDVSIDLQRKEAKVMIVSVH